MDLLSIAAETGSIEEWIDVSGPELSLIRYARALGRADADKGAKVRDVGSPSLCSFFAYIFREKVTPLADPVLERHRKIAYDQRRAEVKTRR